MNRKDWIIGSCGMCGGPVLAARPEDFGYGACLRNDPSCDNCGAIPARMTMSNRRGLKKTGGNKFRGVVGVNSSPGCEPGP